ncbi:MAG: hypothetical protein ABW223_02940 [Rariglobus sp.]
MLITITLLAFLVLLLVSLAALTRVETQVAGNSQHLAQARQNALGALNIALGQLQKFAGPDQRVTTTADLLDLAVLDSTGIAPPAALFPATTPRQTVQSGTRHWTAVWGNADSAIGYNLAPDAIPPAAGPKRGVTPVLLNWLVSGNEAATCSANGNQGGVSAGTAPACTPANPGASLVALVGAQSLGTSVQPVFAPLVDITVPAGAIPGTSASGTTPVGRYAWWVGDEGVKARLNLSPGHLQTVTSSDRIHSFITSQRSGIEFMDRAPGERIGSAYDLNHTGITHLLSAEQLPLLATAATDEAYLRTAAQTRFHDLTAHSRSVIADTYAGGLKKDLTADLADASSNHTYRPADTDPVFTPLSSSEAGLPTWGHLRSWARTRPVIDNEVQVLEPTSSNDTTAGVHPSIHYASFGFNYYLEGDVIKAAFYPLVVLHNPYPHALKATDYDLGIHFGGNPANQAYPRLVAEIAADGETHYDPLAVLAFDTVSFTPVGSALASSVDYFRFKVRGQIIPPGESHIYLLTNEGSPEYSHSGMILERAPAESSIGETNFFTLTGPALSTLTTKFAPTSSIRLRDDNIVGYGREELEFNLVLAKDNSLASSWNTSAAARSDWYQAILRVRTGRRQHLKAGEPFGPAPDFTPTFTPATYGVMCALTAKGDLISQKQGEPSEAASSFRFVCSFESTGNGSWWTSHARAGILNQHTMRFLANGNLRGSVVQATSVENDYTTRSDYEVGAPPYGVVYSGMVPEGTNRGPHPTLIYKQYAAGFGDAPDVVGGVPTRGILFDVLDSPDRLLSLGQLQHAPFARYSFQPSYPFGNSYADLRIPRSATYRDNIVIPPGGPAATDPAYDLSWHLNRALWDRYFVSGVPASLTQADLDAGKPLPNSRLQPFARIHTAPAVTDLRHTPAAATNPAYDRAAAHLLVAGGFNINSTSEQAWRAVLGGSSGQPADPAYAEATDLVETAVSFPRFSRNLALPASGVYPALTQTMTEDTGHYETRRYHRNRGLFFNAAVPNQPSPEAIVNELARSIVSEVRRRGPFLSLADFINRPITATSELAGIKGALQAAIDGMNPASAVVNHGTVDQVTPAATFRYNWDLNHMAGGDIGITGKAHRSRWAMAPSFLSQADILSSLGPQLSARSDTFRIRTYGEHLNPATGIVDGRAWCEAIVQRLPDYVGGESPETAPADLPAASASRLFGRSFKIVSFRWLSPQDI